MSAHILATTPNPGTQTWLRWWWPGKNLTNSSYLSLATRYDAYQPRRGVTPLHEVLRCRQPREVPEGHVRAYLLHQVIIPPPTTPQIVHRTFSQEEFRKAIYDALDRTAAKYPNRGLH